MHLWRIEEEGFEEAQVSSVGNKYLIGNGYLGVRGTLQEYKNEQLTAINLAGIYDQVGDGWREPLNAPNGLYTYLEFNGKELRLPQTPAKTHKISLNFRHSIFERETSWSVGDTNVKINAERFACYDRQHLLAMKYSITADQEGECSIYTGIDGRVWDINGPHYDELLFTEQDNSLQVKAITHESKDQVYVCEAISTEFECVEKVVKEDLRILRCLSFKVKEGKTYTFYKWVSVYTSKDTPQYEDVALSLLEEGCKEGYEITLSKHVKEWENSWKASEVLIEGDDQAMQALNYSIYHLLCIAPRHTDQLSIAARGLSGQTYKGAVFWDTEMFMLDFFLFTNPKVAKTLLKYRIDTLEGAKIKAKQYGYQGAFYAWESQEGGYDACSDYNVTDVFTGRPMRTYFKDKQIHISAAVVYGIMRYVDYTGALDLLKEGGALVVLECANFYNDLLLRKVNKDVYELHDVIGPDEYHERVNNNAYTNRMAKYVFEAAHRIIKLLPQLGNETADKIKDSYDLETLTNQYVIAAKKIFIPQPDRDSGVIEQFDGYCELEDVSLEDLKKRLLNEKEYWGGAYGIAAHTKVIKQADVVTMLNLFSQEYDKDTLLNNWNYYEPRTEHGSSLSACMYSMLACKCDMPQRAYPFFLKSAMSDLIGKGKEWAGLIYIGGTHPASSGGAYMTAIEGFAGIYHENGELKAHPALPDNWTRLEFHINYRDELYKVIVKGNQAEIIKVQDTKQRGNGRFSSLELNSSCNNFIIRKLRGNDMIKGVIFDLDGVLVSTDELHFIAWKQLAERLGITNFTKEDNERQKGVSRMASLEIVLEKGCKTYTEAEKAVLAESKNQEYIGLLQGLTESAVLTHVTETLTMLREKGLLIGVGSVSKNTPLILEKTKLAAFIDKVSCGLDITKSKPDPEVFLIAAKKLGLSPEECLVVEDSKAGIIAAKAANMKSLAVGPEYKQLGATFKALDFESQINWEYILAN